MKHLVRLAGALLIAIAAPSIGRAQDARPPGPAMSLTIAVSGETLIYFPLYVARAGGFFEKEGLDVHWVNVGAASRQAPAVIGGSADVTPLAMFHTINAKMTGLPLVAISDLFDAPALQVVLSNAALKQTGIDPAMPIDEKVKRLHALRLGTSAPGSGTEIAFRKMLQARGYNPDEWLSLQPLGGSAPTLAAFQKGLVDGVVYPAPVPEIIEAQGIGRTVIDGFQGELPELAGVPFLILATSRESVAKKPELFNRAVLAIAKAMQYTEANPAKMPALLRPYFKDLDEPIFEKMVESYRKGAARSPMLTPQQVESTAKWMGIGADQTYQVKYQDVVVDGPAKRAIDTLEK